MRFRPFRPLSRVTVPLPVPHQKAAGGRTFDGCGRALWARDGKLIGLARAYDDA